MVNLNLTGLKGGSKASSNLIPISLMSVMPKKKRPVVEEVFLIYEDGRLISYASLGGDDGMDEDIVGGMLTGVMNLLNDAFVKKKEGKEDVGLYKFEFGERRVILQTSTHFFIAVVILGKEDRALLSKSRSIISEIEGNYDHVLGRWDGTQKDFQGVDRIIQTLLPLDKLSKEERERIGEEGRIRKVFELWSKEYSSMLQDALMPKAHTWKSLSWKLKPGNSKKEIQEDEDGEISEDG